LERKTLLAMCSSDGVLTFWRIRFILNRNGNMDRSVSEHAAGLGTRMLAFALDYLPIAGYLIGLTLIAQAVTARQPGLVGGLFQGPVAGQASGFVLVTLPVTLYFAVQEASARQGTWGKARCNLKVIGPDGERLSLRRALARTALKFLPWELAHTAIWQAQFASAERSPGVIAGFVLVWALVGANALSIVLRRDRRALYDQWAGTAVVVRS
jgi:uncharacterized RDD family membrane protein YckC